MTTKKMGRDRLHGGTTQETFDNRNHTEQNLLAGVLVLSKSSRINRRRKRSWLRGRK